MRCQRNAGVISTIHREMQYGHQERKGANKRAMGAAVCGSFSRLKGAALPCYGDEKRKHYAEASKAAVREHDLRAMNKTGIRPPQDLWRVCDDVMYVRCCGH